MLTADNSFFDEESSEDEGSTASSQTGVVRFGSVRVLTHNIQLGANPSVSTGLPISLGEKVLSERYTLDEFEELFGSDIKKATRLSRRTREKWLKESGHTNRSFDRIAEEVAEIQQSRADTKRELALSDLSEELSQLTPMEEYQLMVNLSYRDYKQRRGSMGSQTSDQAPPEQCPPDKSSGKKKKKGFFSRMRHMVSAK